MSRRSFGIVFLVFSSFVLGSVPRASAAAPTAAEGVGGDPRLRLQELEREVRRLAVLAERSPDDPELGQRTAWVRRHLRLLEGRLRSLDGETAVLYLGKLRAVELLEASVEAGRGPRPRATPAKGPPPFPPAADACDDAPVIGNGTFAGDTAGAGADGESSCGAGPSPDVWWRYVAPADGTVVARIVTATFDTVLSVYSSCPGTLRNEIACNDDDLGGFSSVAVGVAAGEELLIRTSGFAGGAGTFVLNVDLAGSVSGTVRRAATGAPLAGATVAIWDENGVLVASATTDGAGEYTAGVPAGTYFATAGRDGFLGELYQEKLCREIFVDCDPVSGTPIAVPSATSVSGIDFTLEAGGVIAGTVTEAVTGDLLESINVKVWNASGRLVSSGFTDASGAYAAPGLPTGTYFASTESFSGHLDELYDDMPCPGGPAFGCDLGSGTRIAAVAGATTGGIDFVLDRLGAIAGTVVAAAGGQPIPAVDVEVRNAFGAILSLGFTDASGAYTAGGLLPGAYLVKTRSSGFLDELYDGVPCPDFPDCDPSDGTLVEVAVNATTEGVDFALSRLGGIAGTVTAAATAQPITGIGIDVFDERGLLKSSALSDADGRYLAEGLAPGSYFAVTVNRLGFFDELYDDVPCGRGIFIDCRPGDGTPIEVALETTASGVDFALAVAGSLSGRVTDRDTRRGIPSLEVRVWNVAGEFVAGGLTDASGFYAVTQLNPGTYFATTGSLFTYADELFDDLPCPVGVCDPTTGTPIAVALAADTPGIDFALRRLGAVSGRVSDEDTGRPISGIEVQIWSAAGVPVSSGFTGPDGRYLAERLLPGTYFATTVGLNLYHNELYDDLPCPDGGFSGGCDPTTGTPIAVEIAATTPGVDFALRIETGLAGTVTDEVTGGPVPGVGVDVWDAAGFHVLRTTTGSGGRYDAALGVGVYFVSTDNGLGAVDEVYDGVACPDGPASAGLCDVFAGAPVVVRRSAVAEHVDFALAGFPCRAASTALCLNEGRFRVEVEWQDPNGDRGPGRAVELTSDSGYFWFFGPENVELVVKLLDGCFDPFDRFWFFAAGLTNVEVRVTVTDTLTGAVKRYENPLGTSFEPILDTAAFATCDAAAPGPGPAAPRPRAMVPGAGKGPACSAGPNRLCLSDGRFLVETFWRTPRGQTGMGRAVGLTADTGYFWFFSEANVEVVVKVLDACEIEPFHNFWVFAAGLTNVEVTLRVTDTVSGAVEEYDNPLGRSFRPVLDTSAFATCTE